MAAFASSANADTWKMEDDNSADSIKVDHVERKEKRASRACTNCRARKSACHLPTVDGVITTPCDRCKSSQLECVIGSSNRGGRRVRKRTLDQAGLNTDGPQFAPRCEYTEGVTFGAQGSFQHDVATPSRQSLWPPSSYGSVPGHDMVTAGVNSAPVLLDPALQASDARARGSLPIPDVRRESSSGSGNIAFSELQNPSDALGILAQIASHSNGKPAPHVPHQDSGGLIDTHVDYPLVRDGKLSIKTIIHLLQRYQHLYHSYFPLVPKSALDASNLAKTAREEPHLLTAVLVVASKDLTDEPHIFVACSEHMRSLVSALAAGGPGCVEAVEALLVLAEWTPYTSRSDAGHVGRGEEDREAWMHVGTALRIGYFLGLDRYSFHVRGDDTKDPDWQRKRLVWTACYISDRQISIRLGRAFWSRGPGPLTTLRKEDFPMLAPTTPADEDFASIFQATLELTLLFSNVHDVLYSNPGNSMRSHLSGGYIKFIDDFRTAIYGWKNVWGSLSCSPELKATLLMSYDYLRLYTNAFAFHATVKRALSQSQQGSEDRQTSALTPNRVFDNNVGAVGDARFIYEGLDAAKSILNTVNDLINAETSLRYMPLRFYLYSIYSGVFLYRARCVGALSNDEERSVRSMVQRTIAQLERSGIGTHHPGSRYSQLLRLLWNKVERKESKDNSAFTPSLGNPYRPGSNSGTAPTSASNAPVQDPPAMTELMGDFSWTDLDAIGNFAVNGNAGGAFADPEWWSGFLPADSNNFLFENLPSMHDLDPSLA